MKLEEMLEICGFDSFPFDYKPMNYANIWAGRKKVLDELKHLCNSVIMDGLSEFGILTGAYGSGKTHTLQHLKHLVMEYEDANPSALALYIDNPIGFGPKGTFVETYQYIIGVSFGSDKIFTIFRKASEYIEKLATEYFEDLEKDQRTKLMKNIEKSMNEIRRRQYYSIVGETPIPFEAFQKMSNEDQDAWEWLSGALGRKNPKIRGVTVQKLESHILCAKALSTVIRLSVLENDDGESLVYSGMFLLLDQAEDIAKLPVGAFQDQIVGWRTLIDEVPHKLGVIWACDGGAEDVEANFTDAIQRRQTIRPSKLFLTPLEPDEAREFLIEVMIHFRVPSFKAPSSEYPFTSDALDEITNLVSPSLNPSNLLTECRSIIVKVAHESSSWSLSNEIHREMVVEYH